MSTKLKVLIGLGSFIILTVVIFFVSLMGINNTCSSYEESIVAQDKQNQNNLAGYINKIGDMNQVPNKYAADFRAVIKDSMQGRYGQNGSQAMFQFIKEHDIKLDSSLYKQIEEAMESGRDSFAADQKTLLDKKQMYQSYLRSQPSGFFAHMQGFPKMDLSKYDIVINDETAKAFETHRTGSLKL